MTSVPTPSQSATSASTSRLELLQRQFDDDPVLNVIRQQMPTAFSQASVQQLKDYRRALRNSRFSRADLKKLLKPLQGIAEFAEPLLRKALDQRFGPGLDPKVDTLFHPTFSAGGGTGPATQLTLLEAALHNFERKESVTGGFLRAAAIEKGRDGPHPKNIKPEQFADVCRHLNLGQKYQDHLRDVLEPDSVPGDARDAVRFNARATFILNDKADMELYARAAFLRKDISEQALSAVLSLVKPSLEPMFDGLPIALESVTLLGFEIPRVVLIKPQATWTFTQVPLVLYIPQDPIRPFKEFASLHEVEDELRTRLMQKSYQAFFAQLIGERNRAQFFSLLNRHLFPLMPIDSNWFTTGLWHHAPDSRADLRLETDPIDTNLFKRMHEQQIALIKDNARFLAVPTEDEDAKSRQERLQDWLSIGMNILNVASFFVPVLGQAMMVYVAAELVGEVYHGLEDISHGDFEEGFDHLVDVGLNIAFMAALHQAVGSSHIPEPAPIKGNKFVGQLIPITLKTGEIRLWKPNLEPFKVNVEIAPGTVLNPDGIFPRAGRNYLTLDEGTFEVEYREDLDKWQIRHPDPRHGFSPDLEHNGAGAFRVVGEQPEQWSKTKLFRRLGHSVSGLSDTAAEQILAVTATDEVALRQVHVQNAIESGQLRDTITRFQLDAALESFVEQPGNTRAAEFERRYSASQRSTDPAVQCLQRDFPTLPTAVADELIATSQASEIQLMTETHRVPLRLAEAAGWHIRHTRLNRALEGFYLTSVVNPDTETLSLKLLEKLPGWSDQVRLEVRQGSTKGPLLDVIGNPQAPQVKTLVKSTGQYQAFDTQGNELNGIPKAGNNLCDAILHALPDAARASIGIEHVAQHADLNAALARLASQNRQQTSLILGQGRAKLTFNVPQRLKNGRAGYALSGRGRLPGHVLEDHLLDKVGLLELRDTTPPEVLGQMRAEGWTNADINARLDVLLDECQALRTSLGRWAESSATLFNPSVERLASRTRIGEAILDHWQARSLPNTSDTVALTLDSVGLADFPGQLPDFFYESVQQLRLSNTTRYFGSPDPWVPDQQWNHDPLEEFLRRFTHATVLEMTDSASPRHLFPALFGSPEIISRHMPQLRALSLIDQNMTISASMMDTFSTLPNLETLDLSGNRVAMGATPPGSISLNLLRLGLERVGLDHWPQWLNDLVPGHIGEISLANNQIEYLPDLILVSNASSSHATSISLEGNRLSLETMIEMSLRAARKGYPFRFNMTIPPAHQPQIDFLLREQSQLEGALRDWAEAGGSASAPSEETINRRRRLGDSLMDHWLGSVVRRHVPPVVLENIALSEFPQLLPDTFYRNVSALQLRNVVADGQQLNDFLARFYNLESLALIGPSLGLSAPPLILQQLENLKDLTLNDQGMVIDQAALEFLSGQRQIQRLDLSNNTLGAINYTPAMDRYWESMDLDNVGMTQWPEWLNPLLPGRISGLSLANNGLRELPDYVLRNRRYNPDDGHTELALEGNPLTRDTMILAHVGDRDHRRSFSFFMDLPDDILAMGHERADSSHSESEGSEGSNSDSDSDSDSHSEMDIGPVEEVPPTDLSWLVGTTEQLAALDRIQSSGDAPMLMTLIGRLPQTSDYTAVRTELISKVWQVLEIADRDSGLRDQLNAMAADPIAGHTCGDGVRLQFNQLEVQVVTRETLEGIPEADRGAALYERMRALYRLSEVDRLAVANSVNRDEAEVRLAYRLGLAQRLGLPNPPRGMLFRRLAAVNEDELSSVQRQVLDSERGPAFRENATNRDIWVAWLEEAYPEAFAQIEQTLTAERERLEDEFPGLGDAYNARAMAIQEAHQVRRKALLDLLTYQEGLKYGG